MAVPTPPPVIPIPPHTFGTPEVPGSDPLLPDPRHPAAIERTLTTPQEVANLWRRTTESAATAGRTTRKRITKAARKDARLALELRFRAQDIDAELELDNARRRAAAQRSRLAELEADAARRRRAAEAQASADAARDLMPRWRRILDLLRARLRR